MRHHTTPRRELETWPRRRARRRGGVFAFALSMVACFAGCQREQPPAVVETAPETPAAAAEPQRLEWALAIHGGAGLLPDDRNPEPYYQALESALRAGAEALAQGEAALAVVERVVVALEDDPLFNAGRGAVYTAAGSHELDAAIMDGRTLAAGAVAGVRHVRNPVSLARAVLERSPHVLLAGQGADDFAREVGLRRVQQEYYSTPERLREWREQRQQPPRDDDRSTVGAVALDRYGNLAAATSTGGMTNKRSGRIGDVPLIGAGTYADNATAAISCTGRGEELIRRVVAHDVTARMAYKRLTLRQAVDEIVQGVLAKDDGGLIAVDRHGHIEVAFNTAGMLRGAADATGRLEVGVRELRVLSAHGGGAGGEPAANGSTPRADLGTRPGTE